MTADYAMIEVEVAFALPHEQRIIALQVERGTSAWAAVQRSGILDVFPALAVDSTVVGIFSRILDGKSAPSPHEYVLQPGDRVEIYRSLQLDPNQVRLLRATKAKKGNKSRAAEQHER